MYECVAVYTVSLGTRLSLGRRRRQEFSYKTSIRSCGQISVLLRLFAP